MHEKSARELIHEIGLFDFESWSRPELESLILGDADKIKDYLRADMDVSSMGDVHNNNADILTYTPSEDNWSGYIVKINPVTMEYGGLSTQISKVNRQSYELIEQTDIKFPLKPLDRKQRRKFFEFTDKEEMVAIATIFSNILNGVQSHEDKRMLFALYDGNGTETSNIHCNASATDALTHESKELLAPELVAEAMSRFETDGEYDEALDARILRLGMNVSGLVYRAELIKDTTESNTDDRLLDELSIRCENDDSVLDTVSVSFNNETGEPIIDDAPEYAMVWNKQILSELFAAGKKLPDIDAEVAEGLGY